MPTIRTERVPMRDGVRLFTALYFPDDGAEGPCHAILVRNPYTDPNTIPAAAPDWLPPRTVWIQQSCRSTGASEGGPFFPWIHEPADGQDMLAWIIRQPWSSGRVILNGGSYLGATQWAIAIGGHPALVGFTPNVSPANLHESLAWSGGEVVLRQNLLWNLEMWRRRVAPPRPDYNREAILQTLPLSAIPAAAGCGEPGDFPLWREYLSHPNRDAYWDALDLAGPIDKVSAPACIMTGWFDCFQNDCLYAFRLLRARAATEKARRHSRFVIGPWSHGEPMGDYPLTGEPAQLPFQRLQQAFCSALLADPEADPLPGVPAIQWYMLGAGEWRSSPDWPPPESVPTAFHLRSGGAANTRSGDGALTREAPAADEPPDAFRYDPLDPVPTRGGHFIEQPAGSFDRQDLEDRADVLCYTSAPLERDLDVAGRVRLSLWASSSAPDTDFTAQLVDVFPDGRAFNLAGGIQRARARNATGDAFLSPGEPSRFEIDLWSIAVRFRAGHRIRLEISSSDFPAYARCLNTTDPIVDAATPVVADQRIFHDAARGSVLTLPVMP